MKRKETIIRIEGDVYTTNPFGRINIYDIYAYTNMDTKIPDNNTQYKVGDVVEVSVK